MPRARFCLPAYQTAIGTAGSDRNMGKCRIRRCHWARRTTWKAYMLLNTYKNLVIVTVAMAAWCAPTAAQVDSAGELAFDELPALRGAPLPAVDLTGEILFRILLADFAAQRGAWATAATAALEVARQTRDPRMARRALEFGLADDNLPRAWDAARLWRQLAPEDPQAEQAELMLAAANGDTAELARALSAQLSLARDKGEAIVQAQQILSRLSDKRKAFDLLDHLVEGDLRQLPEARAALAQAAYEAGEPGRALSEIRAALAARPDWELAAGMRLQFGLMLEAERTLADTRQFIAEHPEARELRLALVGALMQRGEFDGAIAEVQAMGRHAPEDFELLYLRGALNYEAGRSKEAERLLRDYIQVETRRRQASGDDYDPTSNLSDAQLLLARIAEEGGRYDQAYDLLGRMTEPEAQFMARLRQATVRGKQGRVEDGLRVLDQLQPEDEREETLIGLTRAQILRDDGRVAEAVRALQASIAALPESTELRYDLAMLYEQQNNLRDMEQQLRRIISIDPNHAHAYNALGYTLADRHLRLEEAAGLIERALNLEPNDPAILDSMGWVQYRLGNRAAAIEYLQRSWGLRPDAEVGVHLGEVLWVDGRRDEALQVWREVREQDPDNALLDSTLTRLGARL